MNEQKKQKQRLTTSFVITAQMQLKKNSDLGLFNVNFSANNCQHDVVVNIINKHHCPVNPINGTMCCQLITYCNQVSSKIINMKKPIQFTLHCNNLESFLISVFVPNELS